MKIRLRSKKHSTSPFAKVFANAVGKVLVKEGNGCRDL